MENKPCKHSDCTRYIEDKTNEEYDKMKCGECGYAYINRVNIIDRILYGRLVRPSDKFISMSNLRKRYRQMIWEGTLIGGIFSGIVYWIYVTI